MAHVEQETRAGQEKPTVTLLILLIVLLALLFTMHFVEDEKPGDRGVQSLPATPH